MKQRLTAILLLGSLLIGAAACTPATEAPPTLTPIQRGEKDAAVPTPIDPGQYQPSSVYSTPLSSFIFEAVNVPGMVLYTDGSGPSKLAYINKATGRAFIFCFDPLCTHGSCAANLLDLSEDLVYCAQRLYTIKPDIEKGGGGTSIWSVELDATGMREIYRSSGNEVNALSAVSGHLLFTEGRTKGGRDLYIHDTQTGKTTNLGQITPPEGGDPLDVQMYFAAGDTVYFTLTGSPYLYRTDDLFATSVKLCDFAGMGFDYGDAAHVYGTAYTELPSGKKPITKLVRMSLADGTMETLWDASGRTTFLRCVGLDEEYCYFVYSGQDLNTGLIDAMGKPLINKIGGKLYAIPKAGGEPKVVLDDKFYSVDYVVRCDGVLYVMGHHFAEQNLVARKENFAGTLTDGVVTRIVRN